MKRWTLVLLLAGIALQPLHAQSWSDALKKMLGIGTSETLTETVSETPVPATPSQILGRWVYKAPALVYKGEDLLAKLAIETLKDQLAPLYAKAGLSEGHGTAEWSQDGTVAFELSGKGYTGTYRLTDSGVTVTLLYQNQEAVLHGEATIDQANLTLLLDANEALGIIRKLSPEAAANTQLQPIAAILDAYPGIYIGCEMTR